MKRKAVTLEWKFHEFEVRHDRGVLWYAGAGVVVGVLLIYCAVTANYLFAVLVMLTVLVVFSHQVYTPPFVTCRITDEGITLDGQEYSWKALEAFWIIENLEEGRYTLYCRVQQGFSPLLSIPLLNAKRADQVRTVLERHLEEDRDYVREPRWETLMRRLKI